MGLFGFPVSPYCTSSGTSTIARFLGIEYGHIENFKARAPRDYVCHMCQKTHNDSIRGYVRIEKGRYKLKAVHARKLCSKEFEITDAVAHRYAERFAKDNPHLPEEEAAIIVAKCNAAGLSLDSPEVWKISEPSPGFRAFAIRSGGLRWVHIILPTENVDHVWWRHTRLPGLGYEFMKEDDWSMSNANVWPKTMFPFPMRGMLSD